ncbi:ABC transporter ATP-binding protein [Bacillus cereus]|nr:ABC transporter ATP-binding protein [Bacillus cereus]
MITIKNLTKLYGQTSVLNQINLHISQNKITFIMGKNGAGKTTLFKCLLGLEKFEGEILFNGSYLNHNRKHIYAVFDDSPLYLNLNGYQNIKLLLLNSVSESKIKEVSNKFLNQNLLKKKVKTYSYGQRKKLSLIIGILSEPRYLLLDEISNGLDFETMRSLQKELKELAKNTTIVTTGHQFEFYESIIDELFILNDSHIIQIDYTKSGGALSDLYSKHIN